MSKTVCLVSPPTWDSRVRRVLAQVDFFAFNALSGLLGDILVTCSEGPRGNVPSFGSFSGLSLFPCPSSQLQWNYLVPPER